MPPQTPAPPDLDHATLLRCAFALARRSRASGDHPFGAILVGPDGAILIEQTNGFSSEGGDMTAHAERLVATRASRTYDADFLARCTLYTSAEPCAMCAGALYWAGIGRVVYGQSEKGLKAMTGAHARIRRSICPAAWSSRPASVRSKSSDPCSRTKPPPCRRDFGWPTATERRSDLKGRAPHWPLPVRAE